MSESNNDDVVPRENHEEEMDRLKMEIQRCKDFIQKQQQLLQVRQHFEGLNYKKICT